MADVDDVQDALLDAIQSLAASTAKAGSAVVITASGTAAKDLAEAYAWLQSPANSH